MAHAAIIFFCLALGTMYGSLFAETSVTERFICITVMGTIYMLRHLDVIKTGE